MKAIKYITLFFLTSQLISAQSIVIGDGSSIYVGAGADVCAGVNGNITGNIYGEGTECGQPMLTTFQLSVLLANGWNMVSVPGLHPTDQNVNTWWAYRDLGANVFRFLGGYQSVTTVAPGIGYWMKHSGDRTYNTGDEWPAGGIQIVPHDPLSAASGWNLIGGYELSVSTAGITTVPPGLQSGPVYKYSGGYIVATTLDPGYGYWIKLTGAGQIIIPEALSKENKIKNLFPDNWGKILLVDAEGRNYTLYVIKEESPDGRTEVDLNQYELPPSPPSGMFDIRFASGRIAEIVNKSTQTIEMSGVQYPLTVRVEGIDIRLKGETSSQINVNLKSGEDIVISDATINKLYISKEQIPEVYALEQNYPNPFNPSTTIQFSLPQATRIKINLYNMLGEQVATMAEGMYEAGYHKVTFNASNLPSGTYVYRLESGNYIEAKKMILIK